MTTLGRLLAPRSIAIVGISADPGKHGRRVYENLRRLGFPGEVWGVNPKVPEVGGVDVFEDLTDLPEVPDVVVCAVPARAVPEAAATAAVVGAGCVVVFAGGFAETGTAGEELQAALAAAVAGSATRVLGPNSGGVIVPSAGLAASFLTCLDRPRDQIRSGAVGVVTQSGGTGSYLHNLAATGGSGLAASISTGNEADIDVADGIAALVELDAARSIALVVETVRDGAKFIAAVGAAREAGKPVVLCHLGRSGHSAGMLATHTGALATDRRVIAGVCDSLGITVAATPGEMLAVAEVMGRAAPAAGNRVGVVTHSGGIAIHLADLAEGTDMELPALHPEVAAALAPLLDLGTASNPLDMGAIIGGPHRFAEVVDIFSRQFDVVLAVSSPHPPAHSEQRAAALAGLPRQPPIVHLWMAGDVAAGGEQILRAADLPVTTEPRAAMAAVAGLIRLGRPSPAAGERMPGAAGSVTLSEHESKLCLAAQGIPVVPGDLATSAPEAAAISSALGGTVVVKIASPDILHKAAAGGVRTGVSGADAASRAYEETVDTIRSRRPEARIDGVRVERQAPGVEMLVTGFHHPQFGPMVGVGVGGSEVEVHDDVAMALAPLTPQHARRLVDGLRGAAMLDSQRFGAVPDRARLAQLVVRVGELVAGGTATEVEINPLAWTGTEWLVLDAVVRTAS